MKLSPQITQINTDYKKIKKISVISVICGFQKGGYFFINGIVFVILAGVGDVPGEADGPDIRVVLLGAPFVYIFEEFMENAGDDMQFTYQAKNYTCIREFLLTGSANRIIIELFADSNKKE